MSRFYSVEDIPVHSCLLMPTRSEALAYPRGNLCLDFCPMCGFIANTQFDSHRNEYSTRYEETQGFSSCFNAFARSLAERLIKRYGIYDKDVLEIGCGKGEFLALMCRLGHNRGIGIDPSYVPERNPGGGDLKITFIQDFYSEKYAHLAADFICCRHTLEHIAPTGRFLRSLRKAIGDRLDTLVFFEVPDTIRVLREGAFWDIYYEHCSYFSPGSLTRLFRACGFQIIDIDLDFDNQYILLTAQPGDGETQPPVKLENDLHKLPGYVREFREICANRIDQWHYTIQNIVDRKSRAVVWGSGSKGVAFLTTLGLGQEIDYVVDINPHRQGKFMPGTGQEIVAPEFLQSYQPDYVIVMNPIYCREIQNDLDRLNIKAKLLSV
jgi:SAM-dependent methyltransferase